FMRLAAVVAAITFSTIHLAAATEADAAIRHSTNIPAQPLESALETFAKQRDIQLLYSTDVVGQLQTAGAVGELTAQETLEKLLAGTGLTYKYLDGSAVTIVPLTTRSGSSSSGPGAQKTESSRSSPSPASVWDRFRMAQMDEGRGGGSDL